MEVACCPPRQYWVSRQASGSGGEVVAGWVSPATQAWVAEQASEVSPEVNLKLMATLPFGPANQPKHLFFRLGFVTLTNKLICFKTNRPNLNFVGHGYQAFF